MLCMLKTRSVIEIVTVWLNPYNQILNSNNSIKQKLDKTTQNESKTSYEEKNLIFNNYFIFPDFACTGWGEYGQSASKYGA